MATTAESEAAAAAAAKISHEERTATEPRDKSLNTVVIRKVDQINDRIRVFRLEVPREGPAIRFLPGQWLDVFVPGVPEAGGFTITSAPSRAQWSSSYSSSPSSSADPAPSPAYRGAEQAYAYLELAVQRSPENPPAAWLWQESGSGSGDGEGQGNGLLGRELQIRVGGSFVWPPPGVNVRALRRVVFVAGGVGVNPLMSMLSAIAEKPDAAPFEVEFLYSTRDPGPSNDGGGARKAEEILFLNRIVSVFRADGEENGDEGATGKKGVKGRVRLFLTPGDSGEVKGEAEQGGEDGDVITCECSSSCVREEEAVPRTRSLRFERRRITLDDVVDAAGGASGSDRRFAVVYICGVPAMTDTFVHGLTDPASRWGGMERHRVLCEKWW